MCDDDAPEPDGDGIYRRYCETCRRLGLEPVPRDRAQGLMPEWNGALSGRPEPTTH